MRMNRLMFLWIAAFVISTSLKLVDSTSTWNEETLIQSNVLDKRSLGRDQQTPSSKSFFGFLHIFPNFLKLGSSSSVKNRKSSNKELPGSYPAPSDVENDRILLKSGPSERISSSENSPRALIRARDFSSSTPMQQEWNSVPSHGYRSPSLPSSATSRQSVIGMENNVAVSRTTGIRMGIRARENDAEAFQNRAEEQYDWSPGDLNSKSKFHLDRQEILLPSTEATMHRGPPVSQEGKRTYHEKTNPLLVSGRIKAYAEKVSSIPEGKPFVKIGEVSIPQEKVAIVGDVDGNKVQDYVVSNIAANNYSGTVRLYLMGAKEKFLYTTELVPGKWGFEADDLNPGDRFGETVFRLPGASNSSQCLIAITAPGDQRMKDTNGAVYILEISRKGHVNKQTKLSATAFVELVQEQMREEHENPGDENSYQPTPSSPKQGLKRLDGVTSMVFFNSSGGVQAVINVKSSKESDLLHNIDRHLQVEVIRKTASVGIDSVPSRMASNAACLFNKTLCNCMRENKGEETQGECYEMFESKEEPRRALCLRKRCPPTYKCSCDGVEICRRLDEVEEIYVPHTREHSPEIYCAVKKRLVSKIVPVASS